jgi:hypothetical protein
MKPKPIPTKETLSLAAKVAKIGEVMTNNQAEANAWKKRMLLAVLPLTFPDDWESLSEDEKQRRLDKTIDFALEQERKQQ